MSDDLYTMLAAHEVGHALWTLRKRLDEMAKEIDDKHIGIAAAYVNIVEDVRIERLIKGVYPGLRVIFSTAYSELFEKNMFGTQKGDFHARCFIDRANLLFKVGVHLPTIEFTPDEKGFLDRMDKTETFDDVFQLAKEIYEWARNNNQHPEPLELPQDLIDELKEAIKDGRVQLKPKNDDDSGDDFGSEPTFEIDVEIESDGPGEDSEEQGGDDTKEAGETASEAPKPQEKGTGEPEPEDKSNSDDGEPEPAKPDAGESKSGNEEAPEASPQTEDGPSTKRLKLKAVPPPTGPAPEPVTQKKFDENILKINDDEAKEIVYVAPPTPVLKNIIEDYKAVFEEVRSHFNQKTILAAENDFVAFQQRNNSKVNYLFTQFEMKKQADQYKRVKTHKTGSLDTLRLHTYKYEDDIFKSISIRTDAKNHALVFVIDWSGSMKSSMPGTIEQLVSLTQFCRKAHIPFEVYSLTTGNDIQIEAFEHQPGNLVYSQNFRMRNYLSSRMNQKEFYDACVTLFAMMPNGNFKGGGTRDRLINCTPLDEAIITTIEIIKEIRQRTKAQIVNAVFLTDGDANTVHGYYNDRSMVERMTGAQSYVVEDRLTHKQYSFDSYEMTPTMLQILRDRGEINVVGFYVTSSVAGMFFGDEDDDTSETLHAQFEQDGYVVITNWGFNELYLIKGQDSLRVKNVDLKPTQNGVDIKPGDVNYLKEITKNLAASGQATTKQRLLLDRFIQMVA